MKKFYVASIIVSMVVLFSYCKSSKKAAGAAPASSEGKITFEGNIKPIMGASCAPCHIPAKGGNKKPFDNFESTKSGADDIIRRIQMNPTDHGFMPMRNPKLSDADIATIKKWKEDGLLEK